MNRIVQPLAGYAVCIPMETLNLLGKEIEIVGCARNRAASDLLPGNASVFDLKFGDVGGVL